MKSVYCAVRTGYLNTVSLYSISFTCCSYQKDEWTKSEDLPESDAFSEIGRYLLEQYFNLVFKGLIGKYKVM